MNLPVRAIAAGSGIFFPLMLWEVAGRTGAFGPSWPAFSAVIAYASLPEHRALLATALGETAREAASGFAFGAFVGCALATAAALLPALDAGIERFAATLNGIPILAVGSLCAVTFPTSANPVIVAALGTFFMIFVATTAGLSAAPRTGRDLFAVLGASRAATFARLQIPAAIPAVVDGLRVAAPVAVVGAIIGEWFVNERGLGPLLVNAMQNYQIDLLWAAATLGALLSITSYAALSVARRVLMRRWT